VRVVGSNQGVQVSAKGGGGGRVHVGAERGTYGKRERAADDEAWPCPKLQVSVMLDWFNCWFERGWVMGLDMVDADSLSRAIFDLDVLVDARSWVFH